MSGLNILPATRALLLVVRDRQPMSTHEGFTATRSGSAGESERKFANRLCKLKARGLLFNDGKNEGIWRLTALATTVLGDQPASASADEQAMLVPPRQINWLHGEVYQPKPLVSHRAGAFDHLACPSIQLGEPVAHNPEVRRG